MSTDASLAAALAGLGLGAGAARRVNGVAANLVDTVDACAAVASSFKGASVAVDLEGVAPNIVPDQVLVDAVLAHSSAAVRSLHAAAARGTSSSRGNSSNYKTQLCRNYRNGTCSYGSRCTFAHGESDRRTSNYHEYHDNDWRDANDDYDSNFCGYSSD